jgi:hypothetical protein
MSNVRKALITVVLTFWLYSVGLRGLTEVSD